MGKEDAPTRRDSVDLPPLTTHILSQIYVISPGSNREFVLEEGEVLNLATPGWGIIRITYREGRLFYSYGEVFPNFSEECELAKTKIFEDLDITLEVLFKGPKARVRIFENSENKNVIACIDAVVRSVNENVGRVSAGEVDLSGGNSCEVVWGTDSEEISIFLLKREYLLGRIRRHNDKFYFENSVSGKRIVLHFGENFIGRKHQDQGFFGDCGNRVSKDHLVIELLKAGLLNVVRIRDLGGVRRDGSVDVPNGTVIKIRNKPRLTRRIDARSLSQVSFPSFSDGPNFYRASICAGTTGEIFSSDLSMSAVTRVTNPLQINTCSVFCDPESRSIGVAQTSGGNYMAGLQASGLVLARIYDDFSGDGPVDMEGLPERAKQYMLKKLEAPQIDSVPKVSFAVAREFYQNDRKRLEVATFGCLAMLIGLNTGTIYHFTKKWAAQCVSPCETEGELEKFETEIGVGEPCVVILFTPALHKHADKFPGILARHVKGRHVEALPESIAAEAQRWLSIPEGGVIPFKSFAVAQMICGV